MASDRQRRKDRQRARAAGGQTPPRKRSRSRARDIGLDDPSVDESGLTDNAPAPDPLKNAFPDADQAKAAETGPIDRPAPDGEEVDLDFDFGPELDRGADEVETPRDLVRAPRTRAGEEVEETERKDRGRVITFLRACIDELGRVQWPDRKHVFQATAVVLGFVLIAGGWLGLMDAIWQPLINALL